MPPCSASLPYRTVGVAATSPAPAGSETVDMTYRLGANAGRQRSDRCAGCASSCPPRLLWLLCLLGPVGMAQVRGLHPKVDLGVESLWARCSMYLALTALAATAPGGCVGGRPQSELVS